MAAKLMTPDEAAELLHMDARTLVKWARQGYCPAHPLGEGRRRLWRFFPEELLAWTARQLPQPPRMTDSKRRAATKLESANGA